MELTMKVLLLLITLCGLLMTYVVVPWVKTKATKEKIADVYGWITKAVAAAEMLFPEELQGTKKKQYVIDFLQKEGVKLTDEELNTLIEAAVYELNNAKTILLTEGFTTLEGTSPITNTEAISINTVEAVV